MSGKPKVTIVDQAQSPAAQALQKANEEVVIKDSKGRSITLKQPGVLAQFRMMEALGDELSRNSAYMMMSLPMLFITSIDGDPVYQPKTKLEHEALIQRLDHHGIDAVVMGVREHFGAPDPEKEKNTIKK